jgi:hypothetical protein
LPEVVQEPEAAAGLARMLAPCSTASPSAMDLGLQEATPAPPVQSWEAGGLPQAPTKGAVPGPSAAACRLAMAWLRQRSHRYPTWVRNRPAFLPKKVGRAPCARRNTVQVCQIANDRRNRVHRHTGHREPYSSVAAREHASAHSRAMRGSPARWRRRRPRIRAHPRSRGRTGERATAGTRRGSSVSSS